MRLAPDPIVIVTYCFFHGAYDKLGFRVAFVRERISPLRRTPYVDVVSTALAVNDYCSLSKHVGLACMKSSI